MPDLRCESPIDLSTKCWMSSELSKFYIWPSAYKYHCLFSAPPLAFLDSVPLKDCSAAIPRLLAVLDLGIFKIKSIFPIYHSIYLRNYGIDSAGTIRAYASPLFQQYADLDLCRYCDGNPFVFHFSQQQPRQSHHL
jgi:hypothetical protein